MVRSSRKFEVQLTLERLSKIVQILASISEYLDPVSRPRPNSAKTYGNLERATACRKTCGFMVSACEAPLGGQRLRLPDWRSYPNLLAITQSRSRSGSFDKRRNCQRIPPMT